MFTGIVTDIGTIDAVQPRDAGRAFVIRTHWDLGDLQIGASIAHSGCCLTVTEIDGDRFTTEAWAETLAVTTLESWEAGQRINLERSLRIGDEIGGHLVSGHVDGIAQIDRLDRMGDATRLEIIAPDALAPFIAKKGSICLDGVSLTVNEVHNSQFEVLIIDHTLKATTLGECKVGDRLNIEVDQLARYAARYATMAAGR